MGNNEEIRHDKSFACNRLRGNVRVVHGCMLERLQQLLERFRKRLRFRKQRRIVRGFRFQRLRIERIRVQRGCVVRSRFQRRRIVRGSIECRCR